MTPDKTKAQALREVADELDGYDEDVKDVLRRVADRYDPPEFEGGDYAVWDRYGGRWPAVRCNAVWSVAAHMNRCSDVHMREHYERIERLRVAGEREVIVNGEDLETALANSTPYTKVDRVLQARERLFANLYDQIPDERDE